MTENKFTLKDVVIPISRGFMTFVDEIDGDLQKYTWTATTHVYAMRSSRSDKALSGYLHRIIAGRIIGRVLERNEHVDHIDGDKLNNRRSNLRIVTQEQNNCNIGLRSNNTSGFKGVHYYARLKLWRAEITKNGKRHFIGYFKTPEDAYSAYCVKAIELHGEFAKLK